MSRHRAAHLDDIGAVNPEWEPYWTSIRHQLGVVYPRPTAETV